MSRKMQSDDIPYSFVSLQSQLKHPSLEIDLKRITQKSTPSNKIKKKKSTTSSHSHFSSSARSDSNYNESDTSSILRPISVEAITPPISKNWKDSNSNSWEETPIKHVKATPSPMENLSLSKTEVTKNSFNKAQNLQAVDNLRATNDDEYAIKREKNIIEDEEEERESSEDAIDIDISDEADEKSLNFLDTLINKIKNKGQTSKNASESLNLQPPLSPLTATNEVKDASSSKKKKKSAKTSPPSARNSSQAYLQEQVENQSDGKKLKNKCHQLDKYLEENGYNDIESDSDHRLRNNSKINESDHKSRNSSRINESDHKSRNSSRINESDHKSRNSSRINESDHKSRNSSKINESDHRSINNSRINESDHRSINNSRINESDHKFKNSSRASESGHRLKNNSKISESDHRSRNNDSKISNNSNKNASRSSRNNNNNDFEFLRKDNTNHKNYRVEKENYQICDVRECDYEFEPPYPLDMQHFLIFNVDNQPQSNTNKIKSTTNNYSNQPNSNTKITTPTQTRYTNTNNDIYTKEKNDDSCSIPFSNSSSGSQFSSPSRHGQSPNSPRLSPRLQKMKENSSSRGTSPDAKMLRDKAIGNTFLSTKEQSIWCQLDEYNEEEETDDFDIENEPNRETRFKRQTAPLNSKINRSKVEPENAEIRSRTLNRNGGRFNTFVDNDNNNERKHKSEIRERNLKSFSPSRVNQNSSIIESNLSQRGSLFPNRQDFESSENESGLKMTDKKPKKIIYAEHFVQTEDVSNEDELM